VRLELDATEKGKRKTPQTHLEHQQQTHLMTRDLQSLVRTKKMKQKRRVVVPEREVGEIFDVVLAKRRRESEISFLLPSQLFLLRRSTHIDTLLDPIHHSNNQLLQPVLVTPIQSKSREQVDCVGWCRSPRARMSVRRVGRDEGVE